MASLIWGIQDLVIEDGEIQGETETNGVGGCKISGGNLGGSFVGLQ